MRSALVWATAVAALLAACSTGTGTGDSQTAAPAAAAEAAGAQVPRSDFELPVTLWQPEIGPAQARPLAEREPCAHRDPLRQPFYGDLHVHTGFSMDAREREVLGTPDDAYRFARGEAVEVPGAPGSAPRRAQLERPLDFAAVTDHSEWLGEVSLCTRPDSPVYGSQNCRVFRGEEPPPAGSRAGRMTGILGPTSRPVELCGDDMSQCRQELASVWELTQAAAERAYDRSSACRFTSLHAWEYSYSPAVSKVHRNVILRNELSPELPISWVDTPTPKELWDKLERLCNETGTGCQAIAIPHNPNVSNGRMFRVTWRDLPPQEQVAQAEQRAALEPLVEMMQIKGESECQSGLFEVVGGPDELCGFEKLRGLDPPPPDCGTGFGSGAMAGQGCVSRLDYVRYALAEGMSEERRIGVNPYRFGFVGSTDTHNGTPGDVEEYSYVGQDGAEDATPELRMAATPNWAGAKLLERNPGGIAGVWAEENARDAIFDALTRRETFATSGPRIAPRFFGGWDYPDDLCGRTDLVERGYAAGVPMGGVLPERPGGAEAGPVFAVSALRDAGTPEHPGALLQRIQIVKVWVDDDGRFHEAVHEVAGERNDASVDPRSCRPRGPGHDQLCGVWRDAEFDPARAAVYYARVLENPSCRWHAYQCNALPEQRRPPGCSDPEVPWTIQERAWTSPIWYTPPAP
jgi:hypothetical protein